METYVFDRKTVFNDYWSAYRYAYDLKQCKMGVRMEAADTENDIYYYSSYPTINFKELVK